jgi:hypothetical protein
MIAAGMILDRLGAVARTTGVPDRTPTGPGFRVKTTYGYDPLELRSRLARLLERARAAAERRRPGEPIAVEDRSAPAPPVEEYEPVGPIRYGPPGRILSVR